MPRSDYVALIEALVRDDAGAISPAQRDDALALAVLRYAEDRPRPTGAAGAAPPPVLDGRRDTIPPADREAVCALAAASLLDQLAARRAGDTDSTIGSEAVGRQALADRYARLADKHRKRYRELLALDAAPERRVRPAGAAAMPRTRRWR